jgi:hypothetical protein
MEGANAGASTSHRAPDTARKFRARALAWRGFRRTVATGIGQDTTQTCRQIANTS